MSHFTKCPDWAFKMFASLCFSQVKEQLPENLEYYCPNPPSFLCNGQLFTFIHNSFLITEEHTTAHARLFN